MWFVVLERKEKRDQLTTLGSPYVLIDIVSASQSALTSQALESIKCRLFLSGRISNTVYNKH